MNNENQGRKHSPVEWNQVALFEDRETGARVIVKKSSHRPRPAVEFAIGSAHGKTGLFTPHNLVRYHNETPLDDDAIDRYFDSLLRLKDELKASLRTTVAEIQRSLSTQRRSGGHKRKPGEPGKTGKTARKKAARMAGVQKPAVQPGA